ncbi:hypothetical protein PC113_g13698 [Phytophthora cactorum]|uniref:Uncharacterized protein n=1 Tax=Phytophthora cactorum TaxID=29920 RepID=A0A8T0YWE1_9STRA|nr:hypothetical protein PC113_g13698 [Phytophthora cactorum]KAG2929023.1 hypothetical protein PC117_g14139 [Phytophthora cactorum]KAG3178693.1 hypothetical protein PC128_g16294 [Phytophthora cactorum]
MDTDLHQEVKIINPFLDFFLCSINSLSLLGLLAILTAYARGVTAQSYVRHSVSDTGAAVCQHRCHGMTRVDAALWSGCVSGGAPWGRTEIA